MSFFLLDFNFGPLNFSPCWNWQKFSFDNTFSGMHYSSNAQKCFQKISLKSENLFWLLFRLSYTFRMVSHSWNTMRYESNIDRLAELVFFLFYTTTIGKSFSRIFRTVTSREEKNVVFVNCFANNACLIGIWWARQLHFRVNHEQDDFHVLRIWQKFTWSRIKSPS